MNLLFVEKLDTQPTVTPRMIEAQGGMKPDAGVAATRPEIQPEHCVEQSQSVQLPGYLGENGDIPNQPYSTFCSGDNPEEPK